MTNPFAAALRRYRLGRDAELGLDVPLDQVVSPDSFRHTRETDVPALRLSPLDTFKSWHASERPHDRYPAPPQTGDCFVDAALPEHGEFAEIGRSIVRHKPVGSTGTGWTSTLVNSVDAGGEPTGRLFLLTAAHVMNGSWNWPNAAEGRHHLELAFGFRNRVPNDPATSQEPDPALTIQRWVMPRMVGVYYGTTLWAHRDLILVEIEGGIPDEIWKRTGLQYAGWSLDPPAQSSNPQKNPCAVIGHGGGWPQHLARGYGAWSRQTYRDGFYLRTPDLTEGRLIVGHSGSPMVGHDNRVVAVARTGGSACHAGGRFRATGACLASNWTVNPHNVPGATLLDLLAGGNPEIRSAPAYDPR